MNPVLTRELLERFRTRRAPWFIFGWTLGIGLIGYVVYLVGQQVANGFFGLGRLVASGFMGTVPVPGDGHADDDGGGDGRSRRHRAVDRRGAGAPNA